MSAGELRDDTALQRALETADINPDAFRKALEDANNGDPQSLEKMLHELRRELRNDERAERDAQALERAYDRVQSCLLYTSPSPRDKRQSRMPSSA